MSDPVAPPVCDYCGLPLNQTFLSRRQSAPGPWYCCLGCRFAAGVTGASGEQGENRSLLARLGWAIFFTLNASMFSMALWTLDVYDADQPAGRFELVLHELFRYAALILSIPVLGLLGGVLVENAWDNLRRGSWSTDILLAAGVLGAFAYSTVSVFRGTGQVYFEVGCIVLVAVTIGRWLEASGKLRVKEALRSLEKLLPATVRRSNSAEMEMVAIETIVAGDRIRVLPGERIPFDAVIERNQAAIDEQLITGESAAAIKETGDRVFAGTLNLDGDLWLRVTSSSREGTLQRLIDSVIAAAMSKTKVQRLADRVSAWFVPLVFAICLAVFGLQLSQHGLEAALMAGMSVVVIACPCALGVATPLAVWAAIGNAASHGIYLRSGDSLAKMASIRAICFDKTGTLTTGTPEVLECVVDSELQTSAVLETALSLALASNHALAHAIREYATGRVSATELQTVRSVPGRGVRAHHLPWHDERFMGSPRFLLDAGQHASPMMDETIERAQTLGHPTVCVGWGGKVRGVFLFREQLREDSRDALSELKRLGLTPFVLTGDQTARASRLAESLGVEIRAELMPGDKMSVIEQLRGTMGPVAMVGDGVNDAPALAAADVGIALGCGADVSREAADICLLSNRLSQISWILELAKATSRTVRFNLFWAFAFNVVGIGIAITGRLNPIFAAGAMIGSSVLVIANSMRLMGAPLAGNPTAATPSRHT